MPLTNHSDQLGDAFHIQYPTKKHVILVCGVVPLHPTVSLQVLHIANLLSSAHMLKNVQTADMLQVNS